MNEEFSGSEALWNKSTALHRLGGNELLLNKIADLFLVQVEQKQKAVNDAVTALDCEATRFHSHALKGISGDVGADALRESASKIESLAREENLNQVSEEMIKLNTIVEATIKFIHSNR